MAKQANKKTKKLDLVTFDEIIDYLDSKKDDSVEFAMAKEIVQLVASGEDMPTYLRNGDCILLFDDTTELQDLDLDDEDLDEEDSDPDADED
jgi:hypothetical protein